MKKLILSLSVILLVTANLMAQRKLKDGSITGTSDLPDDKALLELESNTKGFLPPRMTTVQRDAITSPTSGLTIYNLTTHCIDFWNGSSWVSNCGTGNSTLAYLDCNGDIYSNGLVAGNNNLTATKYIQYAGGSGITLPSASFSSTGVTGLTAGWAGLTLSKIGGIALNVSGTPSGPGIATFNLSILGLGCVFNIKVGDATASNGNVAVCDPSAPTTPIVEVTSATGKVWMDRNLGASRVANSYDDDNSYGCKYQWGRANDGHASVQYNIDKATASRPYGSTTTKADIPNHKLFIGCTNCGGSQEDWRVNSTHTLWQGVSAINNPCPTGFRIPTDVEWLAEKTAYNITDAIVAFATPLKLTVAGFLGGQTGTLFNAGTSGTYWSVTSNDAAYNAYKSAFAFSFYTSGGTSEMVGYARQTAASVRCIKN